MCRGEEHLGEELRELEAKGGEGLMLRKPGAVWRSGRSQDLLKVKSVKDDEGLVLAHEKGKGKHKGRVDALRCALRSGKLFSVGSGLKDSEREGEGVPRVGSVISVK